MFTGLVEKTARVIDLLAQPPGKRLLLEVGSWAAETALGESIAINGCCLTVVAIAGNQLAFEAGPETLTRTNLGSLQPGGLVNLERALCVGDRMGGHFVTGHVDGVGVLDERRDEGAWTVCWFRVPADLTRQMASKGSIAVDGVSLTLVDVQPDRFSVALIPHTLARTTLGSLVVGSHVNVETDLLAKYVQRQADSIPSVS